MLAVRPKRRGAHKTRAMHTGWPSSEASMYRALFASSVRTNHTMSKILDAILVSNKFFIKISAAL